MGPGFAGGSAGEGGIGGSGDAAMRLLLGPEGHETMRPLTMIPPDNHIFRRIAWGGIGLTGAVLIATLWAGDGEAAAVLGLFLGLSVVFVTAEDRLPAVFDALFVGAAVLNAAGYAWQLFHRVPFYDEAVHFITTFAITLSLGFLTFHSMQVHFRQHGLLYVVVIASFGLSIGALWEVVEWSTGIIDNLHDTITDLIIDAVGATVAALTNVWAVKRLS